MTTRTRLYELADELYRLAPWNWMNETQLIGLRHPETGELARLSMMGAAGNHSSLAVYLGEEALHRFNLMQHAAGEGIGITEEDTLSLILDSRQLQVSFAVRDELFKSELAEIKALGRKYRGGNYPCFRSFHPGRAPGPVTGAEALWLEYAMEQMLAVAPVLKLDQFGDYRAGADGVEILTRECREGAWSTTWTPADDRLFTFPEPAPSEIMVAKTVRQTSALDIECHFQLLPNPIGPQGKAVFPCVALSVDRASGFVLGVELLSVEKQSHEDLIASVPDVFLRMWDRHSIRPASLRVASESARAMLTKTAQALGVPLRRERVLPALQEALDGLMGFMQRGMN